jgi:hypothetical protein
MASIWVAAPARPTPNCRRRRCTRRREQRPPEGAASGDRNQITVNYVEVTAKRDVSTPMATDTIGSDPLGAKGENRFQEICEDAGLICNKATRDRAGWDFIVEFQFDNGDKGSSLDSRTVPLSCHVQGKTLLAQNDRFKCVYHRRSGLLRR